MRNPTIKKQRYFVQSLAKGIDLLQILAKAEEPLILSEIATEMGTNNTTVTRLCYTLMELGIIERDRHKRYRFTPKVLTLGYAVISRLEWRGVAKYYLEQLFDEVQETVNLSIIEGAEILYIIRIRKRKYLTFDVRIGSKLPVYCTSMGKVLMAMGAPEKTQTILQTIEFRRLTSHTITSLDKFLENLDEVRIKGYAINDEELTIGNRAIAVPILDEQGYAFAAINIAGPTTHYSRKEMEKNLAPSLMRTAGEISDALKQMEVPFDKVRSL